ncbi:hypothetical protein [Brevundimonas sp.]|uniref:hypothetical protein n=1 Tax=Brevundimonas sp. TaxID=1871086 RepID=UPI002616904E|nr:hypothetical protein [Brevundimonas sp.]
MSIEIAPYQPDHAAACIGLNAFRILGGGYAQEARNRLATDDRFGFVDLPPQPTPYARCNVWMEKRL